MAMTPDEGTSPGHAERVGPSDLAAGFLRGHTDDRWMEVADDVLQSVLTASRPSFPVEARSTAGGAFKVSEQVLVASILGALDSLPRSEVMHIQVHSEDDSYVGLTIVIAAQYPDRLIPLADRVRLTAQHCLREILGDAIPEVTVSTMRVHVGDVTKGDPKRR